jgi:3-deoxy-D-manno-octulosonic acid kinase
MLEEVRGLGYDVVQMPPYTIVYRRDIADLPACIGARPHPGSETEVTGRSAIRVVEPGLVVRTLTHGGLLQRITGSRFLTLGRSLRELEISSFLLSQDVPTPIIAGLRFRKKGLFYYIEIISKLVPGSVDLLTHFEGRPDDALPLLRSAGALVRRLHDLGVYHFDLHVKNILLDVNRTPWIIDLDNACRFTSLPPVLKAKNLARFKRSLRKWDAKGRITLPHGWEQAFTGGYNSLS